MEETAETLETQVQELPAETQTETTTVEDDGEPGGKDPKEIARRIEYGKRKAAEKRAEEAERRAIAAEERAKVLAEQKEAEAKKAAEPEYTIEQVQGFIDSGSLKPAVGYAYIAKMEAKREMDSRERQRLEAEPLETAKAEVERWLETIPSLRNDSSDESQKAGVEYQRLLARGLPATPGTLLTAIEKAHGSLDTHRKKQEMQTLTRQNGARLPSDSNGGGQATMTKADKPSPQMVEFWEKSGMPEKERLGHLKKWQEIQAAKKK